MALSHTTKIWAARECRIAKLTADLVTPLAAPGTPPTPTLVVGTAGALTYTYYLVDYTTGSADSTASASVTTALAAAGSTNTPTFTAVPASTTRKIIRSVAPVGISTGIVGYAVAGATTFVDSNLPAFPYVANTSGTTYSPSIPLPGIKAVKVAGKVVTTDLRGDNTLLDSDSMLQGIDVELDHAKLNMDALAVMIGGTITDAGATPNQTSTWNLLNPPVFNYFKVEARSQTADPTFGDFHIVFPKVKSDFPDLGLMEENYQTFTLKCKAVPLLSSGNANSWMSVILNETATAVAV